MRRSPRERVHSISASRGSCHFIFAPRRKPEPLLEIRELSLQRLDAVERRPLEGRPGLRHEGADGDIDVLAAVLLALRQDVLDERHELVEVRARLRRQADHRVDLDQVPASRERHVGRGDHVGVGERLVDDAAQAVGARLRRERESGLAHFRNRVGQAHRERLRPQRRQRDGHAPVGKLRRQAFHERLDLRVIGRREGEQPHFAPAGLRDELLRHVGDVPGVELPHGPVPVARLAEAATLRAAAHDLEAQPVLHDLDRGDHRLFGVVVGLQDRHPGPPGPLGRAQIVARDRLDPALRVVRHVVEGRDVDPVDRREMGEQVAPRKALSARVAVGVEKERQRLLGVADQERVEEVGDRLRVGGAGAASQDDRIGLAAFALPHGQAREVEHVQDVRVVELRLEREAEHVEVGRGRERLGRKEGDARLAHLRLEVDPGGIDALAGEVGPAVDDLVQDLQSRVAHPDLVGVGEGQCQRDLGLRKVLAGDVPLQTHVAPRFLHHGAEGGRDGAGATAYAHRNRGFYTA